MKYFSVSLSYEVNGAPVNLSFASDICNDSISARIERGENTLRVILNAALPVVIRSAYITTDWQCGKNDTILLNGYQSWTDTRELTRKSRMHGLRRAPKALIRHFGFDRYGDYNIVHYSGKKGQLHGFSYGYIRRGDEIDFIGSLNERTGYTILKLDAKKQQVRIEKDCASLAVSGEYELFSLAWLKGSDSEVFDRWFKLMGIAEPRGGALRGYTSWYNHYQNINADIIDRDLEGMRALPTAPEIFQIDDGYQTAVGDWLSIDRAKFPDGLRPIVERIHSDGMLAGLWLAPFVCQRSSKLYSEHPDWLLTGTDGKPVLCGSNWGGFFALDLENPEVRGYLKQVFDTILTDFGFDLVKLDFLYAASMKNTSTKTRGQYMCEAMDLLRQLVGDKLILGCGVPLWPAFGKVDYCRIGCDVGLDWDDKPFMRLLHRERVSTKNTLCNTIFRRQLDGRAFWNDPDVFLLRYENLKLSKKRKQQLAAVNGLFGSVLFMSDNAGDYDQDQKDTYEHTVSLINAEVTGLRAKNKKICISYRLNGKDSKLCIRL